MEENRSRQTLAGLKPGESGVIRSVGNQNGPVKRRLVDMGLTPGTQVTVRKVAPMGDPMEVNLRCYELSLRKEDAEQIQVEPGDFDPAAATRPTAPGSSGYPMRRF